MKRLNNSNFEHIQDIIKELNFNYNENIQRQKEELTVIWEKITGKNISKITKVFEITDDNIIIILCADSFVANELYFSKEKIIKLLEEKTQKSGIKIKDIKFDYKRWKEKNDE